MKEYRLITYNTDDKTQDIGIITNDTENLRRLAHKILDYAKKNCLDRTCEIVEVKIKIY